MKRFIVILTLSLGFATAILGDQNCGFEDGIANHVAHILQSVKQKYKADPMVQAILTNNVKQSKKLSINPKTRLTVEVKEDKGTKVECSCDYIGLAFGTLMLTPQDRIPKNTLAKVKDIVQVLVKKGVSLDGTYSWTPYIYKKGQWSIPYDPALGTNRKLAKGFFKDLI